jgi:7,8-dihydropterin-6-yl-methyl-4-(beta-D-ribofuranosyl)aminobenzene 5'-phosphate synthase
MTIHLKPVDKLEIVTLIDNYVDLVSMDNSAIVQRALPLKDMEVRNSILAEHGFSSLVTTTEAGQSRSLLFDFGFSEHGAAFNAEALALDMKSVEVMALSHGHLDHVGGLVRISQLIGKKGIKLVLHPAAFRSSRFLKITDTFRLSMPSFTREKADAAGVDPIMPGKLAGSNACMP